ncbi:MAG TPA: glucosidase [Armatimonadota bacterium]|nr:glucosidase [Armatimonadota bacterium]
MISQEHLRLHDQQPSSVPRWMKWGPYVSDRQWGTVREDYSAGGTAWDYFPHDQARSRVYRWGEDGIAAICDRYQHLVFSLALWNGKDPILKERYFGLTNSEGNHGEDVKEYYFYLDSTPTHSYMKFLYKYPQAEYPYADLVEENRRRSAGAPEYELLNTGVFDEDRYFDVFVEYAKAAPQDICIRVEVFNRGPEDAPIHVIPHLWFRNRWSWTSESLDECELPHISPMPSPEGAICLQAANCPEQSAIPFEYKLNPMYLYAQSGAELLFTNNESNAERLWNCESLTPFTKDAFHRYIINSEDVVNPEQTGTKACVHYSAVNVPAGESVVFRLRLTDERQLDPLGEVDEIVERRLLEANEFYASIHPPLASADEKLVQRQAFAGLLWSKQIYLIDVAVWQDGDRRDQPESRRRGRNKKWRHLNSMRIMTMPDKWEYPWFAAWDLAFQSVTFAIVDPWFAKDQLWMLLFEQFMHVNAQIPAYEWAFDDLNPPVHAWAVWRVYTMEKRMAERDPERKMKPDRVFLEKCFHKLMLNFIWWVNQVDREGNNLFEGGFLGLDNISIVDRSHLDNMAGVILEQSDATGWMGMFCLNLMRIALELARENSVYEHLATKFFEHYIYVGAAMKSMGSADMDLWDERDNFFYDILKFPDGSIQKFRVRSLVGLIPLYAVERVRLDWVEHFQEFSQSLQWFVRNRSSLSQETVTLMPSDGTTTYVMTIVNKNQIEKLLERVWDPNEFRSPYGLRSLSKYHEEHPFCFEGSEVRYEPAEATTKIMGGNSNWRGPIWFPTSFMMIESLRKLGQAFGPSLEVASRVPGEAPIGLQAMAKGMADRMISIFTLDKNGRRPVWNDWAKFQTDPHWRDYILFYEYFNGDTGAGVGASHQTGWTALVAALIDEWRREPTL